MTDRELMQMALEALVYCEALNRDVQRQKEQAVYALRERLAQPEREWQGLTDEEMMMIYGQNHEGKKYSFGRAIEAKLKEKNNG